MNSDDDVNIHNKNDIYLSSCLHFGSSCWIVKIMNRPLLVGGYFLNNILHSLFSTLQVFVAFPQVGHKNLMEIFFQCTREGRIAGLLPHQILSNSDEWFPSSQPKEKTSLCVTTRGRKKLLCKYCIKEIHQRFTLGLTLGRNLSNVNLV